MIKLLIVDDEPLVCIGIKSMLNWEEYDIEIVSTASNGVIALEHIEEFQPDIVITDIKMPLKTGLEVIKECNEKYGNLPVFIILTSYEEFNYVKEAMKYQTIDYLVKLELTQETLGATIVKAISRLKAIKGDIPKLQTQKNSLQSIRDRFFIRLYNNLFENSEQFELQRRELDIKFNSPHYVVINGKITESDKTVLTPEKLYTLCMSTTEIIKKTISMEFNSYITPMDTRHFTITVCLDDENYQEKIDELIILLNKTILQVNAYFNVKLIYSVGSVVQNPYNLNESYYISRQLLYRSKDEKSLLIYKDEEINNTSTFNVAEIKSDLRRAFEEFDTDALNNILKTCNEYFEKNKSLYVEAMDIAVNILYMAISLLPEGEENMNSIFENEPEGYRSIYRYNNTDEIISWINKLINGIFDLLSSRKMHYRDQVVVNVKNYIKENLDKRLTLNDVAYIFNFNPNYLSHLFAKHSEYTFVEYITKSKMDYAKLLLLQGDLRINEISEKLGYDNAFYFSKVFKKYNEVSPREFQQKNIEGENNEAK